ncbi:MAG: uroporphyrinogen-III C-methyltransferase [Lautropia sp.]|nr:uroporphyrinogen-III C-methyltransferase [Lautropia sp.]
MSSEQHNNRHRAGPAKPAGDVSDAKIISSTAAGSSSSPSSAPAPKGAVTPGQGTKAGAAASPAPASLRPSGSAGAQAAGTPASAQAVQAPAKGGADSKRAVGASASATKTSTTASGKTDGKPQDMASVVTAAAQPSAPSKQAEAAPRDERRAGSAAGSWLLLLLVLGLAGGGWWYTQQRFQLAEQENAKRLAEAEARAQALEAQILELKNSHTQLQAQGSSLENRLAESASQREQLQTLFEDMARVRGDKRLAEAERGLELANQHLALSGNVRGAVVALSGAEKALADSQTASAIALRRVILQDIERLKSLPEVDLTRSVARLDEVISRVDQLPFLADPAMPTGDAALPGEDAGAAAATEDEAEAVATQAADTAAADGNAVSRWFDQAIDMGASAAGTVWQEFTNLVQIRRIDDADRLLLAPDQKRSVREGLRLQLLNARINLLNRDEALFRQDLARGVETIGRYFDPNRPEVKSSLDMLTQLQAEPLQLNLPSLSGSMEALAATRAESETSR